MINVLRSLAAGLVVLAVCVASAGSQAPATKRETPPAPGTPKNFRLPPTRTFTLSNGMVVTLIPFGTVPKVTIDLRIRTGRIDEGPSDVSLSSVVGDMIREGTTTRTPQEVSVQSANMGGSVDVVAQDEVLSINGTVLSDFAVPVTELIADVALRPRFDSTALTRILDKHARDNAVAQSQAGQIARKQFRAMMYGDHPFARVYPTEAMLRGFTISRVRSFYAQNVGARRARLYVSGVYDSRAVEKAVRDAFGEWTAGSPPTDKPPVMATNQQLVVLDRPNSVQSSMRIGLAVPDPSNADYIKLAVTDYLLGGAFGSRITTNIREDKGYSYSPFSFVSVFRKSGAWVEIADVTSNVTGASISEIFGEIERLRRDAPPEAELTGIKNNMAGTFVVQNSSRSGLIGQMDFVNLHDLGADYLSSYVRNMMAVSPEDVRAMARQYIDPSRMTIAIVGDKKAVEQQLKEVKSIGADSRTKVTIPK